MAASSNVNPKAQFAAIGFLFLAVVAAIIISAYFYLTRSADAAIYRNAPECAAQTTDETNCRRQTTAVVERLFMQGSGRTHRLMAHFQMPGGARVPAQIPDSAFWEQLRQGEQVTAEMWRGQITRVKTGGRDEPTSENPEWNSRNILIGGAMAVVPLGIIAVSVLLITLFRRRRISLN